jgi:cysteine synthase A
VQIAKELPEGSTVVTILCDGGQRYLSRIFNDAWLREQGFTQT